MKKARESNFFSTVFFCVAVLVSNAHSDETEKLLSSKCEDNYLLSMCVNTGNSHLSFRVNTDYMCLEVGHLTEEDKVTGIKVISTTGISSSSFSEFVWFMPSENHAIPNLSSDSGFVKRLGLKLPDTDDNYENREGKEGVNLKCLSVTDLFMAAGNVVNSEVKDAEAGASAKVSVSPETLLTQLFTNMSDDEAKTILSNSSHDKLQCTLEPVKILDDRSFETGLIDNNRFQLKIKKKNQDTGTWLDSKAHIIVAAKGFGPRLLKVAGWSYSEISEIINSLPKQFHKYDTSLHPRGGEPDNLKTNLFNFDFSCGAALYAINLVVGMHQRCASSDEHRFSTGKYLDTSDIGGGYNCGVGFCDRNENMGDIITTGPAVLHNRDYETTWDMARYIRNDVRLYKLSKISRENEYLKQLYKNMPRKKQKGVGCAQS